MRNNSMFCFSLGSYLSSCFFCIFALKICLECARVVVYCHHVLHVRSQIIWVEIFWNLSFKCKRRQENQCIHPIILRTFFICTRFNSKVVMTDPDLGSLPYCFGGQFIEYPMIVAHALVLLNKGVQSARIFGIPTYSLSIMLATSTRSKRMSFVIPRSK